MNATEKYLEKLSNEEIAVFAKNIEMLAQLKEKYNEFRNLESLLENDALFKKDIDEKRRIIEEKKSQIVKNLEQFENKIIAESVNEEFLTVMSGFNDLIKEESEEIVEAEKPQYLSNKA